MALRTMMWINSIALSLRAAFSIAIFAQGFNVKQVSAFAPPTTTSSSFSRPPQLLRPSSLSLSSNQAQEEAAAAHTSSLVELEEKRKKGDEKRPDDNARRRGRQSPASINALPPPGLPAYLYNLPIDGDPIYAVRTVRATIPHFGNDDKDKDTDGSSFQPFTIERASTTQPIYVLRNFVSPTEIKTITASALAGGIGTVQAETHADNGLEARPNCTVAFLSHDDARGGDDSVSSAAAGVVDDLSDVVGEWLLDDGGRDVSCWVEDLQITKWRRPTKVVRYTEGGQFVLHHDSCDRVLTVLYFLNGVGGTWFPLAQFGDDGSSDGDTSAYNAFPKCREEALEACKDLVPGQHGLLIAGVECLKQTAAAAADDVGNI